MKVNFLLPVVVSLLFILACNSQSPIDPPPVVNVDSTNFELFDFDSLMYIKNNGLTRIEIDVNGLLLELSGDSSRLGPSTIFYFGESDEIAFNIAPRLISGQLTDVKVWRYGPSGSDAFFWWGDILPVPNAIQDTLPLP